MSIKLLTEHNLEFLSLKGGYTGSSESTLFKMPHCWKSSVTAHICMLVSREAVEAAGHLLLSDHSRDNTRRRREECQILQSRIWSTVPVNMVRLGQQSTVPINMVSLQQQSTVPVNMVSLEQQSTVPVNMVSLEQQPTVPVNMVSLEQQSTVPINMVSLEQPSTVPIYMVSLEQQSTVPVNMVS